MSQNLAAYQQLANLQAQLNNAGQALSMAMQTYNEVCQLLQVQQNLQTQGLQAQATGLFNQPQTASPNSGGTNWSLALWPRDNGKFGGTFTLKDALSGKELKCNVYLAGSKPNDKNMVLNGSVLRQTAQGANVSFEDAKLGGLFVYKNNDGSMTVSGFLDGTQVTNRLDFKAQLEPQQQANANSPCAKASGTTAEGLLNAQGMQAMGLSAPAPQVQQPAVPFAADILTSSPQPADPMFAQPMQQPVTPTTPEDLFGVNAAQAQTQGAAGFLTQTVDISSLLS